jgi:hypothetical protein
LARGVYLSARGRSGGHQNFDASIRGGVGGSCAKELVSSMYGIFGRAQRQQPAHTVFGVKPAHIVRVVNNFNFNLRQGGRGLLLGGIGVLEVLPIPSPNSVGGGACY